MFAADGALPIGIGPVDMFIMSRLNDSTSYFFTWFCKRYRIRNGTRDLGGKEEIQRCPICLDLCTKSIELQCGHAFCRSCLTTSAANNMTSCALCRREQEINPELLRARFDEQRMLNLAQRLALPPPVRSRLSTSGTSMSAGGGKGTKEGGVTACCIQTSAGEEKELRGGGTPAATTPNVESMTRRGHLLFGPWGDVGAMSADDLRRRWKFSGVQASTSPGAATVGAVSAEELRTSWRELQRMSRASLCVSSDSSQSDTPLQVSHSHLSRASVGIYSDEPDSRTNAPDSPCAGGSPLPELSVRWRTLARVPLVSNLVVPSASSADMASNRPSRSTADAFVTGCGDTSTQEPLQVSRTDRFEAAYTDDVGGQPSGCLRKRWHQAFKQGMKYAGGAEVQELSARLALAKGPQGVGGMSSSNLRKRWTASCSGEVIGPYGRHCTFMEHDGKNLGGGSTRGDAENSHELGMSLPGDYIEDDFVVIPGAFEKTHDLGDEAVGAASTSALYTRWCAAGIRTAPVG